MIVLITILHRESQQCKLIAKWKLGVVLKYEWTLFEFQIVKGNINTYLAAKTELNPPIIASKIRILPYSYYRRTVCMRIEIYGCPFRGEYILSF
jgi:hypothetical protein